MDNVAEYKKEKDEEWEREIVDALEDGNDALANALMPPGRCLLDYAAQCSRVDLIELMLDCGYIRRSRDCANSAFRGLARRGRLDLMQQVVLLYSPPTEDEHKFSLAWYDAVHTACENGYLTMLKWLMEHPLGQIISDNMRRKRRFSDLVCLAGYGDHADVMQYLYEIGANAEVSDPDTNTGLYGDVLVRAVADGLCNTMKWLVKRVRFPKLWGPADYIIEMAAFDILKLFHEMGSVAVTDVTQSEQNQLDQVTVWWDRSQDKAINVAAENGDIEMLQLLLSNRFGKCTESTMDRAAASGKLEMIQWLQANRLGGCTTAAMDQAAGYGYLKVVQWLHENRSEGCTTNAIDLAAWKGDFDVLKWLYANRSEGCTVAALENALVCGNVAVAIWLRTHFANLRQQRWR